jgi:uncharacterized protein YbjQ (UPF0145 family)
MSNPEPVMYAYSVKLETTAKGLVMPTIHVYSNDMETARSQAVEQYTKLTEELKAKGISLASEVKA